MDNNFDIRDILNMDLWQKIQDGFAKTTGYMLIVVDQDGNPLLDYSNFTDHCILVRASNESHKCLLSSRTGHKIAAKNKKPVIVQCHAGLVGFTVPIIVEDQYLGSIIAGQTRLSQEDIEKHNVQTSVTNHDEFEPYKNNFQKERFRKEYEKIPIVPYEQIEAASELLFNLTEYLTDTYYINHLKNKLNDHKIEQLRQEQIRSQLEADLREAELKSLISQINPHFLFNVLNTIGRLAFLEGATKTEELIYEFSDLMRYSLERNNVEITKLGDEIDFSRNYLSIQKTRLGSRLRYSFHIDNQVRDVKCPSMIIQPFIENVINYVVEPRSEGGTVAINAEDLSDKVKIEISDNGPGIDEKTRDELLKGTYNSKNKRPSIGISNINKRLKYYYGEDSSLDISTSSLGGVKIEMIIPKKRIEV